MEINKQRECRQAENQNSRFEIPSIDDMEHKTNSEDGEVSDH